MRQPAPNTISLFSGMGGLDLAGHIAGLRVGVATDRDEQALGVLSRALGTKTITAPAETLEGSDLTQCLAGAETRFLIGGPPCGAFSHAGFWIDAKRNGHDPAAKCLDEFARLVIETRPTAFCCENVPGLAFKNHRHRLDSLVARTRRAGYSVSTAILRASDFGVAQARRRLFVVGIRGGPQFSFPEPFDVCRSARWAIGDLEHRDDLSEPRELPNGAWSTLIPLVPPGDNYIHFTERRGWDPPTFGYRSRYWSFLLKLHPDRPSPTLPAQRVTFNGPFHWSNRHLRVRELARLQGFPDWYPIDGTLSTARRHVGNAVPPLLGAAILWKIRRHIGDVHADERATALDVAASPSASVRDVMDAIEKPTTEEGHGGRRTSDSGSATREARV